MTSFGNLQAAPDGGVDAPSGGLDGAVDGPPADSCPGDACVSCGVAGQPCCAGSSCNPGAVCATGACQPCGEPGQLCCAGGSCDSTVAVCNGSACASKNVWAAGNVLNPDQGAVAHWDGSAWSNAVAVPGSSGLSVHLGSWSGGCVGRRVR